MSGWLGDTTTPVINSNAIEEIRDRSRRIERKLTEYLASQGVDTQMRLPALVGLGDDCHVDVPGINASVSQILNAIPNEWVNRSVPVYCKGVLLGDVIRRY